MSKWAPVASLVLFLVVLWTQDVMPAQTGNRLDGDQTDEDAIMGFRLAMMEEERSGVNKSGYTVYCMDNGCLDKKGRCGIYWWSSCKSRISSLCSGICTCCIK
ncbi:uncharacterized protein LOC135220933 [Macrobrachium nipponense]|uniref:uncharacterized protein LOC135220933 n=1 Tax=Macrobrachium nipponense TaxID=159736 RepID=UPI0030C8A612